MDQKYSQKSEKWIDRENNGQSEFYLAVNIFTYSLLPCDCFHLASYYQQWTNRLDAHVPLMLSKNDCRSLLTYAVATTWEHIENPLNIGQFTSKTYDLFLASFRTKCGTADEELFTNRSLASVLHGTATTCSSLTNVSAFFHIFCSVDWVSPSTSTSMIGMFSVEFEKTLYEDESSWGTTPTEQAGAQVGIDFWEKTFLICCSFLVSLRTWNQLYSDTARLLYGGVNFYSLRPTTHLWSDHQQSFWDSRRLFSFHCTSNLIK